MAFNSMTYPRGFGFEGHPGLPEFHMGSSPCLEVGWTEGESQAVWD